MAVINVDDQDRKNAELFLEQFVKEQLPDADLSRGTALRDYVITAMALITAFLRKEVTNVQDRQSIRRILRMTPGVERDSAADDAVSNLFITRKNGVVARGVATIVLSREVDVVIRAVDRFTRVAAAEFKADILSDTVYSADDLLTVRDANGDILHYTLTVPLVAVSAGETGNIPPGLFVGYTLRNPYVLYVENTTAFSGGGEAESTDALLARAPVALTLRGMLTDRSARTVLQDEFDSVDKVVVAGYGDAEMQRDRFATPDGVGNLHRGGHEDIYISSTLLESRVYDAVLGGEAQDPRGSVTCFRDPLVGDFTALGTPVTVGMVLKVTNAQIGEGTHFIIREVYPEYLRVDVSNPFPEIRAPITYTIGDNYPTYDNSIAAGTLGKYTKGISNAGELLLPATPIYLVKDVSIPETDPPSGLPLGPDGRVHFTNRVNTTPSFDPAELEYQIRTDNPTETPSVIQVSKLVLPSVEDGTVVRVVYDTVNDFGLVHNYVGDRANKIVCADTLVKAFHACYVQFRILYSLRSTSTGGIDTSAAVEQLVDYINNIPAEEILNVSDIVSFFQSQHPSVGSVIPVHLTKAPVSRTEFTFLNVGDVIQPTTVSGSYYEVIIGGTTGGPGEPTWPIDSTTLVVDGTVTYRRVPFYTVGYALHSPDGRVIPYRTTDRVKVHEDMLLYPTNALMSLDTSTTATSLSLGVSSRTIRYLASSSQVEVINV